MNSNITEIIKQTIAAGNASSWQVMVGQAAGVAVLTVLGGVAGWLGKKFWNKRKKKNSPAH